MMINQMPAVGSEPVGDTNNKWQKWGVFVSRKHSRRSGVVAWAGQATGNTQMALQLVGRTAAALAMARSR